MNKPQLKATLYNHEVEIAYKAIREYIDNHEEVFTVEGVAIGKELKLSMRLEHILINFEDRIKVYNNVIKEAK